MVKRLTSLRCPRRSTAPRASSLETSISDATISICSLSSSVRPCAAATASSTVGGAGRPRPRPSLVFPTLLMCQPFLLSRSLTILAYKTYYQPFAALQQGNCAVHSQDFNG